MNQPLLKCEHVDFGYENYDVVKDVSMEINPGDYLCIVGENGSGKSTLMKGLLGLIKPTGGVLTLADELRRSGIGYLPQQTPAQKDFPATVQEVVTLRLPRKAWKPTRFTRWKSGSLRQINMEKARNHGSRKELLPGSLRRTETANPDRERPSALRISS
ncbi:MAG: ATP-binding cassette domain-containing protein [Pilosibacter sp.]